MIPKTATLTISACAILLAAASSCKKDVDQYHSDSGLRASHNYRCDTVTHDGPVRMFTGAGEVSDQSVIAQYLELHPWFKPAPESPLEAHPYNIYPGSTSVVYYNGLVPFTTSIDNGVIHMVQTDTSTVTSTQNASGSAVLYSYQQAYYDMLPTVLDMQGTYTTLKRQSPESYSTSESWHITGTYKNETVSLPYTFVGSRIIWNSYPLPLKAGAVPAVPAGDTLLIQSGHVEFKL